jgi:hypothetical protein
MSEHLAGIFGSLTGVDVSGEMIRGAKERLGHLPNATFVETDGASLPFPDASFDFVFSFIVFQHVPTKEAVIGTLRDAHRVLAPGGVCKFQVQGSQNPHYLAAEKDTWLGVTFSEAEMAALAAEIGFVPLKSDGADSQYFWHWWRKPAAPELAPEPARNRGVVVLGCGRSGTSAVTRALNLLGLPLGADDDLLQPQADNPRGFWESRALLKINDEVLETLGGAWHTPPARQPWPALDSLRTRARDAFAAVYGDGPWLWKDPRTCLTFPFWVDALDLDPALVLVHRNPLEVWRSLEAQWRSGKTDGLDLPQEAALALWERCVRNSLEFAAGRPTLVTGYATLLDDPRGWSEVGAGFLRLIGQEPRPGAAAEVSSFVDATHRHAVNDASDLAAEELVSPAQAELAAILVRLEGVHDRLVVPALPPETPWVESVLAGRREALAAARAVADVDAPRNGR